MEAAKSKVIDALDMGQKKKEDAEDGRPVSSQHDWLYL